MALASERVSQELAGKGLAPGIDGLTDQGWLGMYLYAPRGIRLTIRKIGSTSKVGSDSRRLGTVSTCLPRAQLIWDLTPKYVLIARRSGDSRLAANLSVQPS